MKKKLTTLLVMIVAVSALLFAGGPSSQKVYPIDSPVYKAIKTLYISTGLGLPSTTGPWTEAELSLMLSRINAEALDENEMKIYDYVESSLSEKPRIERGIFGLGIGLNVDGSFRAHTNPEAFDDPDMWGGKGDMYAADPFLSIPIEGWLGSIYGYFDFNILQMPRNIYFDDGHSFKDMYFGSNIPFVTPHSADHWDICFDFPYRAFMNAGGSWWNVSVGRDRLSWGPGEAGNFMVGDQLPFHDNLRISAFSDVFKYTFNVSSMAHPENYYGHQEGGADYLDLGYDQSHDKQGIKLFIAHRLEWRIANKVNMALAESIVYQTLNACPDLSLLNPIMLLHNLYIRSNSNSLLTFEIDWSPIRHLNVYGQLAVDEFNFPGEHANNEPPMGIAGMLGAKTSFALGDGMLYASLEGAYTSPYLYLRDNGHVEAGKYGIDFMVGIPQFSGHNGWVVKPLGWRWGGDSAVMNAKTGYEAFGSWSVEGELTYVAHGCFDTFTKWKKVSAGDQVLGLTDHNPNGSFERGSNSDQRNAISHTTILSVSGSWTILSGLELYGQVDYINVQNAGNIKGEKEDDLQASIGIKYFV